MLSMSEVFFQWEGIYFSIFCSLVCFYVSCECHVIFCCVQSLYDDDDDDCKVMFCLVVVLLLFGRYDDPDSAQSSFSMLLGDAPHLDRKVS